MGGRQWFFRSKVRSAAKCSPFTSHFDQRTRGDSACQVCVASEFSASQVSQRIAFKSIQLRIRMMARIIDGRFIAAKLRARVADEVTRVQREDQLTPGLAVILVGNDPASE